MLQNVQAKNSNFVMNAFRSLSYTCPLRSELDKKMKEKDAKGPGCQSNEPHLSSPFTLPCGCGAATLVPVQGEMNQLDRCLK